MIVILPGYSIHNKIWAQKVAQELKKDLERHVFINEWRHWKDESLELSFRYEIGNIIKNIGEHKVDIIAKSVGVSVTLKLIPQIFSQVNKVILCGIASISEDRMLDAYEAFSKIPVKNILCIQNDKDKFVTFENAKRFYHAVNPSIKVILKSRADHEYPYFEDFKKFINN